jgi:hypothetical protein
MGLETECNTTAFCFLLPCFGLFFYLPFFLFFFLLFLFLVLVLVFLCDFAPLRPCVPFFNPSLLSLCVRVRVRVRVSVFYG